MFAPIARSGTLLLATLAFAGAFLHCSSDRSAFDAPDSAPPQTGPIVTPEAAAEVEAGADAGIEQDCPGESKTIYVFTTQPNALYRFDPPSLAFTNLGYPDCATSSDAFSLAIDRRGNAWLELTSGRMFKVRLSDLQCQEVVLNNVPPILGRFGMGFAENDDGAGDTLFIGGGNGLWTIDTQSFDVALVGQNPQLGGTFELTGTGDGKLYAFLSANGVVTHVDKATGGSLETYRTAAVGGSFAFAQWGGDFWLFTNNLLGGALSSVTQYSPTKNTSTIVIPDSNLIILGAGSSTCAPTTAPH